MPKWIDLADRASGARLRVSRIEDNTYLFITGLSSKSAKWDAAIERLGFISAGNARYLIRRVRPGERPSPSDFKLIWPNARIEEMEPAEYLLDLTPRKTTRASSDEREIVDQTRNARRLGRNLAGEEVYDSDLGRFIWRDRVGAVYEGSGMSPALVLRAPDARSLQLCADGYVQSMRMGEVQHSEDFDAFRQAVGSSDDPLARAALHSAIDAAVVRYLRSEHDTAQDAYGESVRMYELLPPYAGTPRGDAAMPVPLSVLAQRLLGDTSGKRVVFSQAYDGAAFAFLPRGTEIHATRAGRDLSEDALGLIQLRQDEIQWSDEFAPAHHAGCDALFFNADRQWGSTGERVDYREALMACRALAAGGRAVLVLAGDNPRQPGRIGAASKAFLRALSERYSIEEACELGSELAGRVGTHSSMRLVSLRNQPPGPGSWQPAEDQVLDVLHSWDEVKARVDEALARAKVAEALSDSISVERATEVNRLQAPYLAFSRVGESRTMVPKNLQAPIQAALADIESQYGPVDAFVEHELALGENTLAERFSPEQVDALALMMARMRRRRAAILADETGVGKGRTLAGLCTWALKQGRVVAFITDRANLFSDLARDLRDIGEWGRVRPLITNSDGHIVEMVRARPVPGQSQDNAPSETPAEQAPEVHVLTKATAPTRMQQIIQSNLALHEVGANFVFTTYSQIAGEESDKATWLKNQLGDALLIVDEAHIAAGSDSSIARQIAEMSSMAWNVAFSSATWAKTPDNLHVYGRAFPESVNVASLTETIRRGGDAFSEVFSSMLARDGALIRREHDLSRLEFVLEIDAANLERNRRVADMVSAAMLQISVVSGEIDHLMIHLSRSSLEALRAARTVRQSVVGTSLRGTAAPSETRSETASIFRSAFGAGSMLYQVQRRMNAALNVDNVVRLALRALEEGRKPVIVFDETSEAFVRRAMGRQDMHDARGNSVRTDVVQAPTLRDLMHRTIEDLATVKVSEVTWEEVQAAHAAGRNLVDEVAQADLQAEAMAVEDQAQTGLDGLHDQAPQPAPQTATDAAANQPGEQPGGQPGEQPDTTQADPPLADGAAGGVDVNEALRAAQDPDGPSAQSSQPKPRKAKVRRVRLDQLPGLTDQQRRTFREGMQQIESLIEQIPPIGISVADEVHRLLRQQGLRTGEISGRSFMLEPMEQEHAGPSDRQGLRIVRARNKTKLMVNKTVDGFNSHELDAIIINRSAATGLSLHASPRFIDHRRRELIEAQPPENPTERVQLYGRVNRYDQLSQPRVSIAATGIPGETRHLMMQNKKLAALNANVRSSRESHAIISTVVDLLNPIGREVCRQFFLDNPLYATRMAQDLGRIERKEVDAASAFTRYVSLLPVAQQDLLYEQVNMLFEEAVLKAELAGENPLKPREHDWRARTVAQDVLFGIDHGGLGSAFDGPVYVRALQYDQELRPMLWPQVESAISQARRKLLETGFATQIGTMLNEARDPIISIEQLSRKVEEQLDGLARVALPATRFSTSQEALNAPGSNPVKRGLARKMWLQQNLYKLVPGARVSLAHPNEHWAKMGATVPHVLVEVAPPRPGKEAMLAQWKLMLLRPGQSRPVAHTLNSLMTQVEFVVFDDPRRPGQPVRDVVNPVHVGSDILLGSLHLARSRRRDSLIEAFESVPTGTRRRTASVLAGNMYLAAEFASQAKVGESVLYTDDRGMRQRGILLGGPSGGSFEAAKLRHMPVRVWVRRAMEDFLLALSGLGPEQVSRDEQGNEVAGEPPCGHNGPTGSPSFWLHTSFSRAWARETMGHGGVAHDDLFVHPGKGIALVAGKDQHRRLAVSLRAAQERIRQDEARQDEARREEARRGGAGQATALQSAQPGIEAQGAAAPVRRRRASEDPAHVTISAAEKSTRGRARGEAQYLTLKADSPAKMRRAIRMLVDGTGLQLYVPRNQPVGHYAKHVVREDLVRRLRHEIADQPDKLARLEEQIERMDTEAAASRRGFLGLAQRSHADQEDFVEVNGQMLAERDLFEQALRQARLDADAISAPSMITESIEPDVEPDDRASQDLQQQEEPQALVEASTDGGALCERHR